MLSSHGRSHWFKSSTAHQDDCRTAGSERSSVVRPQGKMMLSSSLRFLFYRLFIPLSRRRERAGVRPKVALWPVDMMLDDSPSLPLRGIPYSLIYAKRSGTQSSPPRGEEVIESILSSPATVVAAEGGPLARSSTAGEGRCIEFS